MNVTLLELAAAYIRIRRIKDATTADLVDVCELILKKVDLINRGAKEKRVEFNSEGVRCSRALLLRKVGDASNA